MQMYIMKAPHAIYGIFPNHETTSNVSCFDYLPLWPWERLRYLLHILETFFASYFFYLLQLEEDMENYIRFKLMGGQIKMKNNVVPHIFDCQPDRKRAFSQPPRSASVKRVRRRILEEALSMNTVPSSSSLDAGPSMDAGPLPSSTDAGPSHTVASNDGSQVQSSSSNMHEDSGTVSAVPEATERRDVGVQARPRVRSKAMQCDLQCGISVGLSPIKPCTSETGTSPMKPVITMTDSVESERESCTDETTGEDESYSISDYSVSSQVDELEGEKAQFKSMALECTIRKLQHRPRLYMGLPEYAYYTFQVLEKYCKVPSMYIFLTLKKVRTGHSFISLADDFGTSEGNASKIFSKSLPIVSRFLRKCILKPSVLSVKSALPLAFRARYSNVFCIIDCLEIEIEKPSDSFKQSLTWSDYKKCNTLKYLISCTPDGIINFISTGFGGRTSDAIIVQHSGFLDILPLHVAIMADRGFKHIDHLLTTRGCTLIRPPSVSSNVKPTKLEVHETKRIASLRIHVERVIRRLREFSCLAPHACIDNKLIPYTDHITKIVCGLVNLQSGVISGH